MHLHILGICGTFMGGVATLAKSLGHQCLKYVNAFHLPILYLKLLMIFFIHYFTLPCRKISSFKEARISRFLFSLSRQRRQRC